MQIYMILGQGGYTFSMGFYAFGERLKQKYPVSYWMPRQPDLVVQDVLKKKDKIVLIGYSLGANSATWVAGGWQGGNGLDSYSRKVDLLVAYDPTANIYSTPIKNNVKRTLWYHQTAWWYPTSMFFGRGTLSGNRVEEYQIRTDHLAVQALESLHQKTIAAIEALK